MIDFGELKRPQAEAYCRDYADAVPIRAAWLAGELSAAGVDTDDLSEPSSLDRIWVWLTGLVDREGPLGVTLHTTLPNDDPQAGERPPWWVPDRPNPYLSDGLLWLVEAIGCHLATVARRSFPASTWGVYTSPNRRDVNNHRTQLFGVPGGPAEPSRMVYGEVIGHVVHGEPWRPDALSRLYAYLTDPA